MIHLIKTFILLSFICSSILLNAQESQSKISSSYKDGEYNWHSNLSGSSNPSSYEDNGPVKLKFIKDNTNAVLEVQMENDKKIWVSYFPDANGVSKFVRYYRTSTSGSDRCLYFDKKGIWVVTISKGSDDVNSIIAFLGKKPPSGKGMKETISKDLKDGKSSQEKDLAEVTIKDHVITSIIPELVFKNVAKVGEYFQIGITTTRDDGVVLKNRALGGKQSDKDYQVYVGQRSDIEPQEVTIYEELRNCDDFKDEKIRIVIKRTDLSKVVFDDFVSAPCFYTTAYLNRQKQKNENEKQKIESEKKNNPDGITIFSKEGKFGLKDANSKIRVEPIYDSLSLYRGFECCKVKSNSKYGIINLSGKVVVPIKYDYVTNVSEVLFMVKENNKWGFLSKDGNVILPIEYDKLNNMTSEGCKIMKDGKIGYCDVNGKILIQTKYTKLYNFDKDFGIAPAQRDGKYGYVNKMGVEAIPCIYSNILAEIDPSGIVAAKKDSKWGIVSVKNIQVKPFIYEFDMFTYFQNGLAVVGLKESNNDKYPGARYGVIDVQGNIVTPIMYNDIGLRRKDGYFECQLNENGYWGLLNSECKLALYPNFDEIGLLKNGYMVIKRGKHYGYLDKNLINVSPIIYSSAKDIKENIAAVFLNGNSRELKVASNGSLELVSSSLSSGYEFGGNVFVLNDTKYNVNVSYGRNSSSGNSNSYMPGEMWEVPHTEGYIIYVKKQNESGYEEMKQLNEKGQSGMVFRISPFIK